MVSQTILNKTHKKNFQLFGLPRTNYYLIESYMQVKIFFTKNISSCVSKEAKFDLEVENNNFFKLQNNILC